MIWPLIGFALLNAVAAQVFWPHWMGLADRAHGWLDRIWFSALLLICFFGSIGLAFYAGVMVPR